MTRLNNSMLTTGECRVIDSKHPTHHPIAQAVKLLESQSSFAADVLSSFTPCASLSFVACFDSGCVCSFYVVVKVTERFILQQVAFQPWQLVCLQRRPIMSCCAQLWLASKPTG
jgi:hypothetical protein